MNPVVLITLSHQQVRMLAPIWDALDAMDPPGSSIAQVYSDGSLSVTVIPREKSIAVSAAITGKPPEEIDLKGISTPTVKEGFIDLREGL